MHVIHILPSLAAAHGGVAAAVEGLTGALAADGSAISLLATETADRRQDLHPPGVEVGCSPQRPASFPWTGFAPGFPAMLAERGRRRPIDLIHVHELWHFPGFAAVQFARAHGIPYLITPHGELAPWALSLKAGKKAVYSALFQRRAMRRAALVHAVVADEAAHITGYAGEVPIAVIENGLTLPPSEAAPWSDGLRARLPDLADKRVVLFLGRLSPIKGIERLLQAYARLKPQHPDAVLLIVGPDNEGYRPVLEQELRRLGEPADVHFVGMLTGEDKYALLSRAEVCVIPSHAEVRSLVALEAMACETPVVISRASMFPEIAERGAGYVVEATPEQLASAIAQVLASPAEAAEMGRRGRAYVASELTWTQAAQRMRAAYERILSR